MDIEAEIRDLKRRVTELEGSFGFLTTQIRAIHTDLLEFQKATVSRFDSVEYRLRDIQHIVQSLRDDLPDIVATAVDEALRRR